MPLDVSKYVDLGFTVIPTLPNKKAAVMEWEPYQTRKPTEAELLSWFGNGKPHNVAIVTGAASGVIVLDVDGDEGRASIAGKELPPTPTVKTARGVHYYYKWPGYRMPGKVRFLPGLDTRGDGNYAIAPPSKHQSGAVYEWAISPDEMPFSDPPAWLLACHKPKPTDAPAKPTTGDAIPEGQRDSTLASLAGTMRRRGMSEAGILAALRAENAARCVPPLDDAQVVKIAGSIGRYAPAKDGAPRCAGVLTLADVAIDAGNQSWTWPGWIPSGSLSMIAGAQSVGKSYLAAHCVGVLTGAITSWPDGASCDKRGPVVLVETESMRGEWARRLMDLGAPLDRVLFPTDADGDAFFVADLLKDLDAIEDVAHEHQAAAVVIDSLSGGHSLDENSADMRRVLKGLAQLAGTLSIPVVVVHHLRKRNALEPDSGRASIDRVRGSSTVTQFCRSIIGLWRLDDAPDAPVRAEVIKSNFGKPPTPFGFTVSDDGLSFCDAPEQDRPMTVTDRAAEFLRAHLRREPMRYTDLLEQAELEGISKNSLYSARYKLGVIPVNGEWSLPAMPGEKEKGNQEKKNDGNIGMTGNLGKLGNLGNWEKQETGKVSRFPVFPVSRGMA